MASKLGLYKGAMQIIGEAPILTLTDANVARRALDAVYDDVLAWCIEQGQWNFAMRTAEIPEDASIEPEFGFTYAFEKPDDWVRTCAMSYDEYFDTPLMRAHDAPDYWYADIEPIFVQYVSNHASYGNNLTRWPASFTRFVEHELAERICTQVTSSTQKYDRISDPKNGSKVKAKRDALSKDAMNDVQPKFPPSGSIVQARMYGHQSGRFGFGSWRFR